MFYPPNTPFLPLHDPPADRDHGIPAAPPKPPRLRTLAARVYLFSSLRRGRLLAQPEHEAPP